MCGGRGTRLDATVEKPLFKVAGRPMVDRVLDALEGGLVERIYPVVSPHAADTRDRLVPQYETIETAGEGYVADLRAALDDGRVARPVLTVVADLPLLGPAQVNLAVEHYDGRHLTVCTPASLKEALDVSTDRTRGHGGYELAPVGLNIVAAKDTGTDETVVRNDNGSVVGDNNRNTIISDTILATFRRAEEEDLLVSYDARLAVNVNRLSDAAVAEVLADGP